MTTVVSQPWRQGLTRWTNSSRSSQGYDLARGTDTSASLAFFDTNEPDHSAVVAAIIDTTDPLIVSPYAVAELDHLVGGRHGVTWLFLPDLPNSVIEYVVVCAIAIGGTAATAARRLRTT